MQNILIAVAVVCLALFGLFRTCRRVTAREQATNTLRDRIRLCDVTIHPQGRIDAVELFDDSLTLCYKFNIEPTDLGIGCFSAFSRMAERSFLAALKNFDGNDDERAKLSDKSHHFSVWRALERDKIQKAQALRMVTQEPLTA